MRENQEAKRYEETAHENSPNSIKDSNLSIEAQTEHTYHTLLPHSLTRHSKTFEI